MNFTSVLKVASILIIFLFLCSCQNTNPKATKDIEKTIPKQEMAYDSIQAKAFGADEYGMKKYVIAFLKKGPNRDRSKEESAALQAAHMENIGRLAEAGKLVLAGPFLDDGDLRGIYIFDVETVEEAQKLTQTDPAIQAGSLVMELKPWYGSAAVMGINAVHGTLAKNPM